MSRLARRVLGEELVDPDRADPRVARGALVQRAEERDAAVGVVLPAVLAVEDHRDQRGRVVAAGVADGVDLAEEVGGGDRSGAALVVEPHLVGHRMIAEDDRQLGAGLAEPPGPVEPVGVADVAPAVAPDQAVRRAGQDLLVGGDPSDAVLGQQGDERLADRALAGPHPARRVAEPLGHGCRRRGGRARRRPPDSRRDRTAARRRASPPAPGPCPAAGAGSGDSTASSSARPGRLRPARGAGGSPGRAARAACPGTRASPPRCSASPWRGTPPARGPSRRPGGGPTPGSTRPAGRGGRAGGSGRGPAAPRCSTTTAAGTARGSADAAGSSCRGRP